LRSGESLVRDLHVRLRVDASNLIRRDASLVLSDGPHVRAELPVEVREREGVRIDNPKPSDSQASESLGVGPSAASATRDRDEASGEPLLLLRRDQAEISFEGDGA
jgi:hypothetical protein